MKTSFAVYLVGYGLVIIGIWYGVRQIELIDPPWPTVIALVMVGLGIVYAYSRAQADAAQRDQARSSRGEAGGSQSGAAQGGAVREGGTRGNSPQA